MVKRLAWIAWVALIGLPFPLFAESIAGRVVDPAGAPVSGASVRMTVGAVGADEVATTTDGEGRFSVETSLDGPATVDVEAPGFAPLRRRVGSLSEISSRVIVLSPAFTEEVTVTATRTPSRLGDTAASVAVLGEAELAATAAPALDEALRQVPGFSLFRRSGSRTANPTAQGVSLRGVGASGASRALVLADGVPLNDPFGGWIYWGRVPRAAVERVEVLRGSASDLYGSAALSGVIQVVRRSAGDPRLVLEVSGGERDSADGSLYAGRRWGLWGASVSAEGATTGGYVPVAAGERGPVDAPADSRHTAAEGAIELEIGGLRLGLRGSRYEETRDNGTGLQDNATAITSWSAGLDGPAAGGSLSVRAWGGEQDFRQDFSAVSPDRSEERMTRSQEVPSRTLGASAQATRPLDSHALLAGVEAAEVRGESRETVFSPAGESTVASSGRQRSAALFVEDVAALSSRLSLTVGVRLDRWENGDARRTTVPGGAGGPAEVESLPTRTESAWSPRATLLLRASDRVSFAASAYRGFRAPTLNELYRSFRVGDAVTLANPELTAERSTGAEAGVLLSAGGRLSARATLYWMEVDRPVANRTLAEEPGLVTRRRENLGATRSRGLEAELTARPAADWTLSAGYLLADATVTDFPADPSLAGRRLAQVPRHQATAQVRFAREPLGTLALQGRWVGDQFEDDRNRLRLGSFATLDLLAARPVARGVSLFAAVENLFDRRYEVGRTPVTTLGPPRLARLGVRVRAR